MKSFAKYISQKILNIKFYFIFFIAFFPQSSFAFQDIAHELINEEVSLIHVYPDGRFNLEYF